MFKIRSVTWVFWLVIMPTTAVLALLVNTIALLGDVGYLQNGLLYNSLQTITLIALLSSFIYFPWISFKKASTRVRGFAWALLTLLVQVFITGTITLILFTVSSAILFFTPESVANTDDLQKALIDRFESKHELPVSGVGDLIHVSYYRLGEEFGFDMVIRTPVDGKIVSLGDIRLNNTGSLPDDLSMTGQRELCASRTVKSEGEFGLAPELAEVLCDLKSHSNNRSWGIKQIRVDWTVLVVYFSEQQLLWISEVEW